MLTAAARPSVAAIAPFLILLMFDLLLQCWTAPSGHDGRAE
jgi:hypothetical protein